MILILDHFDSFTWNLYQCIGGLGFEPYVVRTDITFSELIKHKPTHLILSPGHGHPKDVAIFHQAIRYWKGKIPILGVCLGHQAIGLVSGVKIERNFRALHGKASKIYHQSESIFSDLPNPFDAGRYHSLVVVGSTCEPNGLEVIAQTQEGEVMAVRSQEHPTLIGIQFHPESILTPKGLHILGNFLKLGISEDSTHLTSVPCAMSHVAEEIISNTTRF